MPRRPAIACSALVVALGCACARGEPTREDYQACALVAALKTFKYDHGRYPTRAEGLAILTQPQPTSRLGYESGYAKAIPVDSWGRPYVYVPPSARYGGPPRVYSLGPDGIDQEARGDDIVGNCE